MALAQPTNTLRRTTTRIDFSPKASVQTESDILPKRKKNVSSSTNTRRKPTLIRNLGGTGGPKGASYEDGEDDIDNVFSGRGHEMESAQPSVGR